MAKFKTKKPKKSKSEGKIAHKKTVVDGITFDSKMESQYYTYLKEEKKKGNIIKFDIQPSFILMNKYFIINKKIIDYTNPKWDEYDKERKKYNKSNPENQIKIIQGIKYIADFIVTYKDGTVKIIDVKGIKTADFKIKEKLFNYAYPQYKNLLCVTWDNPSNAWLTYDEFLQAKKERKKERERKKKSK